MSLIPEWALQVFMGFSAILMTIVAFFLSMGIKMLIRGQATMSEKQTQMGNQLSRTCEQIEAARQWQVQHQQSDDDRYELMTVRFEENTDEHRDFRQALTK